MRNIAINRKNLFDYVRLYAAFQVLISHGQDHLNLSIPKVIINIFSYGGVPIFFAISGFLVTISWVNSNFNLKGYLISRFLRIFPALWVSAIISFFLIISLGKFKFAFSFKGILWLLSQASPFTFWNPNELRDFGVGVINGSLWTIPVELQFYIFVPLLISLYILLKKRLSRIISSLSLIFIAALSVSVNILFPPLPAGDGSAAREGSILIKLLYVSFAPHICTFIIGMLLALIVGVLGQKICAKLFICFGLIMISIDHIPFISESLSVWLYPIYTALIFIGIGLLSNPLKLKFDISYGLYLYHMLVVNLLLELNQFNQFNILYIYLFCTFSLAFLSWYFVESPILKLKKNIINERKKIIVI